MQRAPSVVLLTPAGRSAVASLLVAGAEAVEIVSQRFEPAGRPLGKQPLGRIAFGRWRSDTSCEEVVVCRRAVDRVEIHCHGGHAASRAIVNALVELGCREVTWNEWIAADEGDRIRAEARIALAAASTERTALVLLDQYEGALRRAIAEIAELVASEQTSPAMERIDALLAWSWLGRHLTMPFKVVLAGPPNAGKSSLINALVGYERAIVHAAPGTTRDVVTAQTAVDGWPIELMDTAGLRAGSEPLEAAGIELARRQADAADLVLAVFDRSRPWGTAEEAILSDWPGAFVVWNKCDLAADASLVGRPGIAVSALCGEGLPELIAAITTRLVPQAPPPGTAVPFSSWQCETLAALRAAIAADDPATGKLLAEFTDPAFVEGDSHRRDDAV